MREQIAALDRRLSRIEHQLTPAGHHYLEGALASLGRVIEREQKQKAARETV